MFELMSEAEQIIERVVAGLQPEVLDTETATQLVERFARLERMTAAGKALCAQRVAGVA